MTRSRIIVGSVLGLLSAASLTLAQEECDTVLAEEGSAAYEDCRREERERTAKASISAYKDDLKDQKERVEEHFALRELQAEEDWERSDFQIERELSYFRDRSISLRRDEGAEEERRRIEGIVEDLELRRKLLKREYDRFKRVLGDRERLELSQLDFQAALYELQVRGWPGIPFTP